MKNTECLNITLLGLTMIGIWNPEKTEKNALLKYLFYFYFVAFQLMIYFPTLAIETVHVFAVMGNVEEIMGIVLLLLTHCTTAPKIYIIWYRQNKIKSTLRLINSATFSREDPQKQAILAKAYNMIYYVSLSFYSSVFFTGFLWAMFPMLKPTLELPLGYPYLDSKDPKFIPLYVYEIFCMTILGLGVSAADFLICGTMVIVSGALDLLYYELENIGNMENSCLPEEKALPFGEILDEEEFAYQEAIACVKFHGEIINLMKDLEDMFSLPTLMQFIASSVIICGTAFKISISKEPVEILTMMFYIVCVTFELIIYCYFGELVRFKSENLAEGAYSSAWPRLSGRTRRVIFMVIMRAQRPLTFTAGNVLTVTLTTFTKVLRASYSYFAVLNQRHSNEM